MLDELSDGAAVGDEVSDGGGEIGHEADVSGVGEGVEDGGCEVGDGDGVGGGFAGVFGGGADDLAHFEAAAGEEEGSEFAPVVAAAVFVDFWGAAHFAAADDEDILGEAAVVEVLDEGGDGVVEGCGDVAHALVEGGVVFVGVEVPDEVCGDGDEAAAGLDEAACHEEEFSERADVVDVVVVIVPAPADAVRADEACGVVAGDGAGVLVGDVEGVGDASEDDGEGLLLEAVEAVDGSGRVGVAFEGVEFVEEVAAVVEAGA